MTELRLTRSKDIVLYLNGEELYGVVGFRAISKSESREIHEYLSGEPYAVMKGKTVHEIRMSVLSLFSSFIMDEDGFTLTAVDGDARYDYSGCSVICRETEIKPGANVSVGYVIRAEKMTKRGISDV